MRILNRFVWYVCIIWEFSLILKCSNHLIELENLCMLCLKTDYNFDVVSIINPLRMKEYFSHITFETSVKGEFRGIVRYHFNQKGLFRGNGTCFRLNRKSDSFICIHINNPPQLCLNLSKLALLPPN